MRTSYTLTLAVGLFLCTAATAQITTSQDSLFLTNGNVLTGKVEEIGLDEVKYRTVNNGSSLVMVIEKTQLSRVKLSNGEVITVNNDPMGVGYSSAALSKTHVVKVDFLSLAFDHLTFGYEQMLKPWMNIEAKAGYIGIGANSSDYDHSGFLVKAGVKFISKPEFVMRGMKLGHPMRGKYIKPEIMFSSYSRTPNYTDYYADQNGTEHVSSFAFNVVFGKQSVLGEVMTLDYFVGIGYGSTWSDHSDDSSYYDYEYPTYSFSHAVISESLPIALSAGMTLGVLF